MAKPKPPIHADQLAIDGEHLYKAMNGEPLLPAVLIGCAALEQALATLLGNYFLSGSTANALLDPIEGCLGPMMSRARVAYCLGLISGTILNNLQQVMTIRNRIAHSHVPIDFGDSKIQDCLKNMKCHFDTMIDDKGQPTFFAKATQTNARDRFAVVVHQLYVRLLLNAMGTTRCAENKTEF